jgi:predicted transposase YdaD
MSAGQAITVEDVHRALEEAAEEGTELMGTIAQELLRQGEQRGEQRGLRKGLLAGIGLALKLKFGLAGTMLLPEIYALEDVAMLQAVQDSIEVAATPEELRQIYQRQ